MDKDVEKIYRDGLYDKVDNFDGMIDEIDVINQEYRVRMTELRKESRPNVLGDAVHQAKENEIANWSLKEITAIIDRHRKK